MKNFLLIILCLFLSWVSNSQASQMNEGIYLALKTDFDKSNFAEYAVQKTNSDLKTVNKASYEVIAYFSLSAKSKVEYINVVGKKLVNKKILTNKELTFLNQIVDNINEGRIKDCWESITNFYKIKNHSSTGSVIKTYLNQIAVDYGYDNLIDMDAAMEFPDIIDPNSLINIDIIGEIGNRGLFANSPLAGLNGSNILGPAIFKGAPLSTAKSATDDSSDISETEVRAAVGAAIIATTTAIGAVVGTVVPVAGNGVGAAVGAMVGTTFVASYVVTKYNMQGGGFMDPCHPKLPKNCYPGIGGY